ncbi:MAG: Rieske 2Fe-2S domain-containing protein [Gammaproteobacteria bacterium]|nr:Rieske 2Fe-2S domain-containing protein [Gammaproteobacteria bacterium]
MNRIPGETSTPDHDWRKAAKLDELRREGVALARIAGKQIALFATGERIRACDNRCPHEGYPLTEGSLSAECVLTCNWHNWKFSLDDGSNLYGGDRLRIYPVEIRGGEVWVDIAEAPWDERYASISASLRDAFDDYSYDRIAREIARLLKLGADPLDCLRHAIDWSWQRMEFGWTHAYAGMADWLRLYDEHDGDAETQLLCLVESVAHAAYDVLREPVFAYREARTAFVADEFVDAIEREDEDVALAMILGGIDDGLEFADFEPALSRAALMHYNDFGHSLIYVTKAGELIARLGPEVMPPLLLSLVRSIVFASREDRIPEFRAYATHLENWGQGEGERPVAALWRQLSINKSLATAVACSDSAPEEIYRALLLANAVNQLSFDLAQDQRQHVPVSGNVGWLDFTHGLTFANAVRRQCRRFPELWPQGLLQMACFNGRNAGFTTADADPEPWLEGNPRQQMAALIERVLDHGQGEHIVSVHLLKTALAVREELVELDPEEGRVLLAALARFIDSPLKRRHPRRTAYQSLQFIARE